MVVLVIDLPGSIFTARCKCWSVSTRVQNVGSVGDVGSVVIAAQSGREFAVVQQSTCQYERVLALEHERGQYDGSGYNSIPLHHTLSIRAHVYLRLQLLPSVVAPPRNLSGPEARFFLALLLVLVLVLPLLPGAGAGAADIDRATGCWHERHNPAPKFELRLDDDGETHLDGLLDSNPCCCWDRCAVPDAANAALVNLRMLLLPTLSW